MKNENPLLRAMKTNDELTENGCVTNSTSSSDCIDLFFTIGAMRSKRNDNKVMFDLFTMFDRAFAENPLIAMKILFWSRDARGGAGERSIFRQIEQHLAKTNPDVLMKNIDNIPEYGRWDDLFALFETDCEDTVINYIVSTITDESNPARTLLSKWLPRLGGKVPAKKKAIANKIRKALNMSPAEYRKMIVNLTNVVETPMCQKEFGKINYEHVPSVAMAKYQNAFRKNDNERFGKFLKAVETGDKKINAGTLYPYDVIRSLRCGDMKASNITWQNLPNYLEGNTENIMAMVDVSESMNQNISGSINAMDISISLGIYISERLEGPFKDHFITFTSIPTLQRLTGNLFNRYNQLKGEVGYDTNIQAAFEMLLDAAVKNNVSPEDMPNKIVIISDMEFNAYYINDNSSSCMQMVDELYEKAGYKRPQIIFWKVNVLSKTSNVPVKFDESGTALISGFSPTILTSVLGGDLTPERVMLKTINNERYNKVIV